LNHPPYSPDLALSDFHLFLHLKKHLLGQSSTTMMRCKKKSRRGSNSRRQTSMNWGYRNWFEDLIIFWQSRRLCWKIKLCTGSSFTVWLFKLKIFYMY
jgi:hypothetical protein